MSDLQTVVISAGASLLAAVLVTGFAEWRHLIDRRRDQARRDAEVLGPVLAYLVDMQPDRRMFNLPGDEETAYAGMREMRERLEKVRGPLLVLRAGHHDAQVRDDAQALAVALANVQTATEWLVSDMVRTASLAHEPTARVDYGRASELADRLLERITP